jgi:hypothetical protein
MSHKILFRIGSDNHFQLNLAGKRKIICSLHWQDDSNLSRLLLAKIDQLLTKNKIGLDKIFGYKIMSEVPENYTSFRIAKITLEGLKIGERFKSSPK